MSLLTVVFRVKFTLSVLKNLLKKTLKTFISKFGPQ